MKLLNDKNDTIGLLHLNTPFARMEYCLYKPFCSDYQPLSVHWLVVGLVFEMPHSFNRVTYLGRGEHETYADRKLSGRIGIYHTDAERMFHYYVLSSGYR